MLLPHKTIIIMCPQNMLTILVYLIWEGMRYKLGLIRQWKFCNSRVILRLSR